VNRSPQPAGFGSSLGDIRKNGAISNYVIYNGIEPGIGRVGSGRLKCRCALLEAKTSDTSNKAMIMRIHPSWVFFFFLSYALNADVTFNWGCVMLQDCTILEHVRCVRWALFVRLTFGAFYL
jgi:hypothetical protein